MLGITVHSVKRLWDVTIRTREHTQTRHTCTQDPYMHNTKVCHVQSISRVRTHTHTHTSQPLHAQYISTSRTVNITHTHMAVALQSASEVPQLKGSKQRVQTNSNCFSFFLFFLVHPTTDNCTSSSTTRFVEVHLTGKVHTLS